MPEKQAEIGGISLLPVFLPAFCPGPSFSSLLCIPGFSQTHYVVKDDLDPLSSCLHLPNAGFPPGLCCVTLR